VAGDGEGALLTVRMTLSKGLTFDPRNENMAYLVTFSGDVYQLELDKEQIWQWHKSTTEAIARDIAVEPVTFNIIISTKCDLIQIKDGRELKIQRTGNGIEELCSPISGFDFVTPSHLIAAGYYEERLIHFDLSAGEVQTICTGNYGYNDGWIDACELNNPEGVHALTDFIYIGETGSEGGGVRRLSYNASADNKSLWPVDLYSSRLPPTSSVKVITANIPSLGTEMTHSKSGDNPGSTRQKIFSEPPDLITNSSAVDLSTNLTKNGTQGPGRSDSNRDAVNEDMTTAGECSMAMS